MGRLVSRRSHKAGAPAGDGDLGTGLAGAVGIVAAEAVVLAVAVVPLPVGVDLVGGDHHHRAGMAQRPQGLKHVEAALHVGAPGAERISVTAAHQGLCRQVKHHFGITRPGDRRQRWEVADVGDVMVDPIGEIQLVKQVRIALGLQGDPRDDCPSSESQRLSQLPLKPVWPVTRTRRRFQN